MTGEELNPGGRRPGLASAPLTLLWGVKRSFIDYLLGLGDGRCSADDGCELVDGDLFKYEADPATSVDPPACKGVLKFRGDLRFAGHEWLLFVRIANPWLELRPGTAILTVDGSLPDEPSERLPLVTSTLRWEAGDRLIGENVRLTEKGSELFGGVYSPGEVFDDLVIEFTASRDLTESTELS